MNGKSVFSLGARSGTRGYDSSRVRILRAVLLKMLRMYPTGILDQLAALSHCHRQILATSLIQQTVSECGLQTGDFYSDEDFEVHFEIMDGRVPLACVTRAWGKLAFSVGQSFAVERDLSDSFYMRRHEFSTLCKQHGVKLEIDGSVDTVDITIGCSITERRFNATTLTDALRRVEGCAALLHPALISSAIEGVTA